MAEVCRDKAASQSADEQDSPSATAVSTPTGSNYRATSPTIVKKRGGRRPKFTPDDDLIIAREVSAAKAHIAGCGDINNRFAQAASRANLNKKLSQKVTAKSIQDRYKKIQHGFDRRDAADRKLSGVGGEIGELDELLGMMAEGRNDVEKEKMAVKAAQEEKEAKKERVGRELVASSLIRKRGSSADEGYTEGDNDVDMGSAKKRRGRVHTLAENELKGFGNALKESDLARISFEQKKLDFEREKMVAEREEREKDRALRREERDAHNELELEKFKLLIGAFTQAKK